MMVTIKKFYTTRRTISEGLKDETYLLQEDVVKVIKEKMQIIKKLYRDDFMNRDQFKSNIAILKDLKSDIEG